MPRQSTPTRTGPRFITVYITEDMRAIMERHGPWNKHPKNFVFPIMQRNLNPQKQYERVPLFTRFISNGMKAICVELGIDKTITTIVSRHTFSTQLKRVGVGTEFIQEALSHTDKHIAENYLVRFEREVKKQYAQKLISFKMTFAYHQT